MDQGLLRFVILSSDEERQTGDDQKLMLININHIISIKPISIMTDNEVVPGYWIRTSNGKRYRAISIPPQLEALFKKGDLSVLNQEVVAEDRDYHPSFI